MSVVVSECGDCGTVWSPSLRGESCPNCIEEEGADRVDAAAAVVVPLPWERIARAYVSAPALRVIEQVARPAPDPEGWSAKSLAAALGMPLSTVAYHVRGLRDRELVVQSGERRAARGSMFETFYRLVTA